MEVHILDVLTIFKNMKYTAMISLQIQDWVQILIFEMIYLFVPQVFEKNRIIRGTQIPSRGPPTRSGHSKAGPLRLERARTGASQSESRGHE